MKPSLLFAAAALAALVLPEAAAAAAAAPTANAPAAAGAAVDYFLKIDGIAGESTDARHKDEIEVLSFSWGAANPGSPTTGTGGGSGKVSLTDLHFVARVSSASPKLFLHCANGKHVPTAVLTARKAGRQQQEFLKVVLTDILVSSYQTGAGGSEMPTDQVSLDFAKIEYGYLPQRPDGSLGGIISAGWDRLLNKAP